MTCPLPIPPCASICTGSKLRSAAESDLPDLIDRIAILPVLAGETDIDVILAQPFKQTHKPGVDAQNVRADHAVPILLLKLKRRALDGVGEDADGMVRPGFLPVVQNQNRLLRRRGRIVGLKRGVGAQGFVLRVWCIAEIKYWHDNISPFVSLLFISHLSTPDYTKPPPGRQAILYV